MFIELTEFLRCPRGHAEAHLVCLPAAMDGRRVTQGLVGCPECRAEFPIREGVVDFGAAAEPGAPQTPPAPRGTAGSQGAAPQLTAEGLATLLDLRGPGGFLVLVGGAARLGPALAALVPGVHVVCVNAPPAAGRSPACSYLVSPDRLPLTTSSMRATVIGADHAAEPWLADGGRVLLRGLRFVAEDERASPAGIVELARGAGVFVGEKRDR